MVGVVTKKRFVNTPTVAALHLSEFGEEVLPRQDVEELEEEYNSVDGNEDLYKTIFSTVNSKVGYSRVSGNEDFMSSIGDGIKAVLKFFSNIFKFILKLVFGTATDNKKKLKDLTDEDLKRLAFGRKKYNVGFKRFQLEGNENLDNLDWLTKSIDQVGKQIKSYQKLIKGVDSGLVKKRELIKKLGKEKDSGVTKDEVREDLKAIDRNNVLSVIGSGLILFGSELTHDNNNIKVTRINLDFDRDQTYMTDAKSLKSLLDKTLKLVDEHADLGKEIDKVHVTIKNTFNELNSVKDSSAVNFLLKTIKAETDRELKVLTKSINDLGQMTNALMTLFDDKK